MKEKEVATTSGLGLELIRAGENADQKAFRLQLQNFSKAMNQGPDEKGLTTTPDGNAQSVLISYTEMTLDEYFFGLWDTINFRWTVVQNEIVGAIDLVVTHPSSTGGRDLKITRTGAAAIQIMVDKFEEPSKQETALWGKDDWAAHRKAKNAWALDVMNKKQNALDMGFPKLKSECVKNASNSLGKLFGRDINRKLSDDYKPLLKDSKPLPEDLRLVIETADSENLLNIWNTNAQYQGNPEFLKILNERREALAHGQE